MFSTTYGPSHLPQNFPAFLSNLLWYFNQTLSLKGRWYAVGTPVVIPLLLLLSVHHVSPAFWWAFYLNNNVPDNIVLNDSLLNGHSTSLASLVVLRLYWISIGRTGCWLYISKNGVYFVDECLLNLWANRTPSITYSHSDGLALSTFNRESFIVLF